MGSEKFIPVNKFEASKAVLRPPIHIEGLDIKDTSHIDSVKQVQSVHGLSVFKRTSPVSQDIFKALPTVTLDMGSTYESFCPLDKSASVQNPRLAVLENFKEISRIMTQNFITHKRLEKRYEKSSIPKLEMNRKRIEEEAANRMTNILKMMHSPNNFSQQMMLLPF